MSRIILPDAPRGEDKNLSYRKYLSENSINFADFRTALIDKWKADPVFWFNTCGWTQDPRWRSETIDVPIILWKSATDGEPFQEEFVREADRHIEIGRPLISDKSREQGATVLMGGVCARRWQLFERQSCLIGSQKQDRIDGKSFADQIMPKIDYILDMIHRYFPWAVPEEYYKSKQFRTFLNILHPISKNIIKGEATNPNFARSGRYGWIWYDEHSTCDIAEEIQQGIALATRCFIFTYTPKGWNFSAKLRHSGNIDIIPLDWKNNPQWREGWTTCEPGCDIHPEGGHAHSDRYNTACDDIGRDPVKIAQELDLNYTKSGNAVFDTAMIGRCKLWIEQRKPVIKHVSLKWDEPSGGVMANDRLAWFRATRKWRVIPSIVQHSMLRVWKPPVKDHVYAQGSDTAKGLDHGDGSIAYIADLTTGEIVAELACKLEAEDFAIECVKMAKFYGTSSGLVRNAFCCPEWNDQGITVGKRLALMGMNVYIHKSDWKVNGKEQAMKFGVPIETNKNRLIGDYLLPNIGKPHGSAVGYPLVVCPFVEFWNEAETFIRITPKGGEINSDRVKMAGVKKMPDDRIMAMLALCYGAVQQYHGMKGVVRHETKKVLANV